MSRKKTILLFGFPILLITLGITYALLFDKTEPVTNKFRAASIYNPSIIEDFTAGSLIKKNVKISMSEASYQSYIRAKVIINWQDDNGNVLIDTPIEGVDYSISYTLGKWMQSGDGYFYYKYPVNDETEVLINEAKVLKKSPKNGYKLNIEVVAQAVQSIPQDAVVESWNVLVDQDGNISLS